MFQERLRNWNFTDYVRVKKPCQEWVRRELGEKYSPRDFGRLLYDFVARGGEIDEQVERRPEYVHYEFHYDLRLELGGRRIYVETVLDCSDPNNPDDPSVTVVSIHDA